MAFHTGSKLRETCLTPLRWRRTSVSAVLEVPISVLSDCAILVDQVVCWRQFNHVTPDGLGSRHVEIRQIPLDTLLVQSARKSRDALKGLQFRREKQLSVE